MENSKIYEFCLSLEYATGGIIKFAHDPSLAIHILFYGSYFFCGLPAALLVSKKEFKRSIEIGLVVSASAVFLLVPGARAQSFELIMAGIFLQVLGFTILQVACNPYIIYVGETKSGASRLALACAHNSFGTWIAPLIGTLISTANIGTRIVGKQDQISAITELIVLPYVLIAVIFVGLSVLLHFSELPELSLYKESILNTLKDDSKKGYRRRHTLFGVIAIFALVCSEVLIGANAITPYLQKHITAKELAGSIALVTTFFWGGQMVGRFMASSILRNISPRKVLLTASIVSVFLSLVAAITPTQEGMFFFLAIGLFSGAMWPCIYTLAISGVGKQLPIVSGLLVMAVSGGACAYLVFESLMVLPSINGRILQVSNLSEVILVATFSYAYIVFYAAYGYRLKKNS